MKGSNCKGAKIMNTGYKQLTRSTTDRMIAGVCGGIAQYANIDPTVVRLLAVLLFFLGMGPGIILAYFILMIIIPEQPAQQNL
jgi:phage shock protein C